MRRQSLPSPPLASVRARKGGIKPGLGALQTPWVHREPECVIQCVEVIPEAHTWPQLVHLSGKPVQRATPGTQSCSFRNKRENYFQFKSRSGSKRNSCLLFSAVQSSPPGWLELSQHVCACVCVCLPWLLSAVRLPPLDWTPVAFAVKGHSTWVDILSLTSAMNLPEPSHSKAPLWSRQQLCDCFLLRHMHTMAHTHTHT